MWNEFFFSAPQLKRDPLGSMSSTRLSPETERRLNALFSGGARRTAANLLVSRCGTNLPFLEQSDEYGLERIRFAALKVSGGDLGKLESAVQVAQQDWRDVLVAAGFADDVRAHEVWFPDHAA